MKKKVFTASLVCLLVLIVNVGLNVSFYKRFLPYYWGSNEISDKRSYLLQNSSSFNTIFLGSSKTQNQILPQLFDERAAENGLSIHSYNFGVGGLTPLESLNIYENLLCKDSLHFKYAFIELDWIATIKYENLNVARSFYWLTSANYSYSVNSILRSSVPFPRRAWGLFHYSLGYVENMLNVGKVQEVIKFQTHTRSQRFREHDSNVIHHGFIPITHKQDTLQKKLYDEVISSSRMCVENLNSLRAGNLSRPFLNRLEQLISVSKKRGIDVYFIMPLQWKYYQYVELMPVINALKEAKVICLFDVDKYKDIYSPDHFADPNHLNSNGAALYTEQLFKDFLREKDPP